MKLRKKSVYDGRIYDGRCLLDINTIKKVSEKLAVYALLVRNLQIIHPDYKFEIAFIVVGAMGYVPKCLVFYLKMVGFEGKKNQTVNTQNESKI